MTNILVFARNTAFLLLVLIANMSCGGGGSSTTPPSPTPSPSPSPTPTPEPSPIEQGLSFENRTLSTGLSHFWGPGSEYDGVAVDQVPEDIQFAAGLAASDIDLDGDIDLIVVGGKPASAKLYQNQGDNTYIDIAETSGLVTPDYYLSGPSIADIDSDGDLDIIIGTLDSRILVYKQENSEFTLQAQSAVNTQSQHTYGFSFADIDSDQDLDMLTSHRGSDYQAEHLWENNGTGEFTNVSEMYGLAGEANAGSTIDFSFSPAFADVNSDGHQDILYASDFFTSTLLINNGEGGFDNATTALNIQTNDLFGMGSAIGDYDNDGDLDWFVTNIFSTQSTGNKFFQNNGDGTFEDVSFSSGTYDGGWGWAACFADFNNDGFLDLFMTNGDFAPNRIGQGTYPFDRDPAKLFISNGDGTFTDRASEAGVDNTGVGRAALCYDVNGDGKLDIIIQNNNPSENGIAYYENKISSDASNWLSLTLRSHTPNTQALGARIWLETNDGKTQMRELNINSNFVSQSPLTAHFGLGALKQYSTLTIQWPNGDEHSYPNLAINEHHLINQP